MKRLYDNKREVIEIITNERGLYAPCTSRQKVASSTNVGVIQARLMLIEKFATLCFVCQHFTFYARDDLHIHVGWRTKYFFIVYIHVLI